MYFLSDPSIFTMNKALVALLVIALVAGVFVEDGNAVLRAGRDRIAEKLQRAMEERREAHAKRESSNCYNGGKQANNTSITRTNPNSTKHPKTSG